MRALAALVHIFTALGTVTAFMAVLAIHQQRWEAVFGWLGAAFVIDGLDGMFARKVGVAEHLPRFSGERLDLVIDYLTYVFVPVLALLAAGYLPGTWGMILAVAILLSSLFHFADEESKAEDYSFVGFPAVWNIIAFYIFVLKPDPLTAGLIMAFLVVMTFVPMKWVHPFRVQSMKPMTLAATAIWAAAAMCATWVGFESVPQATKFVLIGVAVYCLGLAIWTSWLRRKAA